MMAERGAQERIEQATDKVEGSEEAMAKDLGFGDIVTLNVGGRK